MNHRRSLFTMLELIVVMAIISLMMVMSVPVVTNLDSDTIETYVERITALFENARMQAMLKGKPVTVRVDPENRKIFGAPRMFEEKRSSATAMADENAKPVNDVTQVTIPEWLKITIYSSSDKLTFKFFPDGTASIPPIVLSDADGDARYIVVMPLTGRVNEYDHMPEFTLGSETADL